MSSYITHYFKRNLYKSSATIPFTEKFFQLQSLSISKYSEIIQLQPSSITKQIPKALSEVSIQRYFLFKAFDIK